MVHRCNVKTVMDSCTKADGTVKIEGWHINLGTVIELDENYFAIHLPPGELHCFRKGPKTTLEAISSELIMVLSEYIKLKGKEEDWEH